VLAAAAAWSNRTTRVVARPAKRARLGHYSAGIKTVMFVRWQRRPRLDGDASLVAYLLENRLVDGRHRQSVIAYLGTIRESAVSAESGSSSTTNFWGALLRRLDGIGRLDAESKKTLVSEIAHRVPLPVGDEYLAAPRRSAVRGDQNQAGDLVPQKPWQR